MSKIFMPIKTKVEITKTTLLFQEASSPEVNTGIGKNNLNEEWNTSKYDIAKIIMTNQENNLSQIEAHGDFYAIVSKKEENDILDENGEFFESESLFISGLRKNNFHQIKTNGKLILYIKNPIWQDDIQMVIMEFKGEHKNLESLFNDTNKGNNFSLFLQRRERIS